MITTRLLIGFHDATGPTLVEGDGGRTLGYTGRLPHRLDYVLELSRAEWEEARRHTYGQRESFPVPDVEFVTSDGDVWPSAEAALTHELRRRFDVGSLDELQEILEPPAIEPTLADRLYDLLAARGLTFGDAAEALGVEVAELQEAVSAAPKRFVSPNGKVIHRI